MSPVRARTARLFLALLLLSSFTFPQELPRISPERARADLARTEEVLTAAHPALHRYTGRVELDDAFVHAAKQLSRPMDAIEVYRVLAPVVTAVKDGHLELLLPTVRKP